MRAQATLSQQLAQDLLYPCDMPDNPSPAMSEQDIERYVDAAALLVGLPIGAEYRAGVLRYFGLAAGLAGLVMEHPLGIADEPAPAFVPVDALQP